MVRAGSWGSDSAFLNERNVPDPLHANGLLWRTETKYENGSLTIERRQPEYAEDEQPTGAAYEEHLSLIISADMAAIERFTFVQIKVARDGTKTTLGELSASQTGWDRPLYRYAAVSAVQSLGLGSLSLAEAVGRVVSQDFVDASGRPSGQSNCRRP